MVLQARRVEDYKMLSGSAAAMRIILSFKISAKESWKIFHLHVFSYTLPALFMHQIAAGATSLVGSYKFKAVEWTA